MNATIETTTPTISKWRAWGILLLLSLIWGSSYILIKWGLTVFPAMEVASIRLGVSTIAFAPILFRHIRKIKKEQLGLLFLVGLTGTGLPSFLFPAAQTQVNSSLAGILNSLTPLFTLVIGFTLFSARIGWSKTVGILVGLLGAICLFAFSEQAGMGSNAAYGLLIVLACFCYATSTNLVGFHLKGLSPLTISTVSFSMVGLPALIYLWMGTDFVGTMQTHPNAWEALGYITVLALFSTVMASVIFYQLIQWTSPVFGSTVSYLVPVVALLWGTLDGEAITLIHFIGMGLILAGVYLSKQ